MKKGIDIAHPYQIVTDFNKVKSSGIDICFVKATEGIHYENPNYYSWINDAKNCGLEVGAYHFYRPNDDPKLQANYFLEFAGWNDSWIGLALDFEIINPNQEIQKVLDDLDSFLEKIGAAIGKPPIFYTYPALWKHLNSPNPLYFHSTNLWIADYLPGVNDPANFKQLPDKIGWEKWIGWQFKSDAIVPGIIGTTDLSWWNL